MINIYIIFIRNLKILILEIFTFELQVSIYSARKRNESTIDGSLFRERGSKAKYFSSPFERDDDEARRALMYRESYVYAFRY